MKQTAMLLAIATGLVCNAAVAQDICVERSISQGGNDLFEFFLDTTGAEGTFDTFELILQSAGQYNQVGVPAEPVMQPSEDSGFSAFLTAPGSFGGQGLSAFGVDASTDTPSLISGIHVSLGDTSASTQGNYLIAQIVSPAGIFGTYTANFFDDGVQVASVSGIQSLDPSLLHGSCSVPEPASAILLGLGGLAMTMGTSRRRRVRL